MSDCGICLSTGYDFGDNDFQKWDEAFKSPMVCCECDCTIPAGMVHEKAKYRDEDDRKWITHHTCPVCAEIAWAFFCDSRLYGSLWDYMEDVFDEFSVACINRLRTPAAKKELQRCWIIWKFGKVA